MFQQLVSRIMAKDSASREVAAAKVLLADPLDLMLHLEQVWDSFNTASVLLPPPVAAARKSAWANGGFVNYKTSSDPAWDHLGYSFVIENTRAVQIFKRVVREYRSGESLGVPSIATQRWLDATEAMLFGATNPVAAWLPTSSLRPEPEAVRRNGYWRMFGLDLAFGNEDNTPPGYLKAQAFNGNFLKFFEEILNELWQAITNTKNTSGANNTDDDRIYRLAEQLQYVLRSRRQASLLAREELTAAAALGWVDLTLSADSPVVLDMRAQATSAADRLQMMGERVGMAPHSKSAAFFSMASDLSIFLRTIESGIITGPEFAWILYLNNPPGGGPNPIGPETRRLITEWGAATGKNLKSVSRNLENPRRDLVTAR